jgi:hypothetical protein
MRFVILGEQLVWQQADPLQEEHSESAGRGEHVRGQGGRGGCHPWRLARTHDVARQPVGRQPVFRRWAGLRRLLAARLQAAII